MLPLFKSPVRTRSVRRRHRHRRALSVEIAELLALQFNGAEQLDELQFRILLAMAILQAGVSAEVVGNATQDAVIVVFANRSVHAEGKAGKGAKAGHPLDAAVSERIVFVNAGAAAGKDITFQFAISGAGGGEWFAAIKDGACTVQAGRAEKPTTTIKMVDGDFLELISGRLDGMKAYTSGKLKVEGLVSYIQWFNDAVKLTW